MNAQLIGGVVIGGLLALWTPAVFAAQCNGVDGCDDCSACAADYGGQDYIEIGVAGSDVTDSSESNDQRGYYPEDWLTSGRVTFNGAGLTGDRFELRWQDISSENGRAWGRLSVWPATLSFNGSIIDSYAWNMYNDLTLQHQQISHDDVKLRFHDGELDNMLLRFEHRDYDRDDPNPLSSFEYQRLSYQYNFNLGCDDVKGSFRQVATSIDAPRTGTTSGETDSSILKLDARLSDTTSLYGRGTYSQFNYDNLPDDEFYGTDYTVGLKIKPHPMWELRTDYRAKEYPDDNTVPSHVENFDAYSASVAYLPGCGDRLEAGYRRSCFDYAQLHMQDPATRTLLRGTAQVTPGDIAGSYSSLSPRQDETWFNAYWSVTDRLTTLSKVSYTNTDGPGTDLVVLNSSSLFYDERWKYSTSWSYDVNGNDLLSVAYSGTNAIDDGRDREFDSRYIEGSWSRCTGGNSYLTLAVSNADASLDTFGLVSDMYTTTDTTYLVNFTDSVPDFDYGLDLAVTNGSGEHDYDQLAAGADLTFRSLGPVNLSVGWFDRNYDTYPVFDTEALEFALSYRIEF